MLPYSSELTELSFALCGSFGFSVNLITGFARFAKNVISFVWLSNSDFTKTLLLLFIAAFINS